MKIMNQTTNEMDFDVLVEPENGHFVAKVVTMPHLRGEGGDRQAATEALIESLQLRMQQGDLIRVTVKPKPVATTGPRPVIYDFRPRSIMDLAGIFKDDPDWMEICREAYRERDEEKRREFPE